MPPSLVVLITAVTYAVVMHGGDDPLPSKITLLLVSLAALLAFCRRGALSVESRSERAITWAAVLFPSYVAFQLIPLPLPLLEVLSPARAELARTLVPLGAGSFFAPISISPPTTWMHLFRAAGYVLTFLTVRHIRGRVALESWQAAVPLVAVGVLEATWALSGNSVAPNQISGTYYSKNHFAGLLEMTLPFTCVYAVVVLGRGRTRDGISAPAALAGSALLAAALAVFVAITSSLSKGGALSTFGSLLVMALLAASRRLAGRTRIATFTALVVTALLLFLFITPNRLVEQFAVVVSDDQSEGRLPIWQNTLHLIAAHPLVGVGLGNFYPALLPYQTYGNALAWVNAHNDYLQLLVELGFVAVLLPLGLMGLALSRAVRATLSAPSRDVRLLGLGCTGALTALAIHSLADYNTYILANGVVLAWIAGIASTLAWPDCRAAGTSHEQQTVSPQVSARLVLATVTLLWTAGSIGFLQKYRNDPEAERLFCRVGICDTATSLAARTESETLAAPVMISAGVLLGYLRRDPAEPSLWEQLGVAYQSTGHIEQARYCFSRALALAPNSPPNLLTAAEFYFDVGEEPAGLNLISRVLLDSALFDQTVFERLAYRKIPAERVVNSALPDRRSAQAYLRDLIASARPDDARLAWRWMAPRGYGDDASGRDYLAFLVGKERGEAAAADWADYVRGRDADYPARNLVFNGGFELDPSGSPFDWKVDTMPGVAVEWDTAVRHAGQRSLRLRFDGTANAGDLGVSQTVYLQSGRYRLSALVKTDGVSTDQGIAVRVVGPEAPQRLDFMTEGLRGTQDWTRVEQAFDAPAAGGLFRVTVVRRTSLKFDNLITGAAWLDQLSVAPER